MLDTEEDESAEDEVDALLAMGKDVRIVDSEGDSSRESDAGGIATSGGGSSSMEESLTPDISRCET